MQLSDLETRLAQLGKYHGAIDGEMGPQLRGAVLEAMTDGPDTPLSEADFQHAADLLSCDVAAIKCVRDVEATANPFVDGRPTILFEPHRFSAATGHSYDASHPRISSLVWNRHLYPGSQDGRWSQVLEACSLDVDAAFASASYGAFQVLGENYHACGYTSSFEFALGEAQSERNQLYSFVDFVRVNRLDAALRSHNWAQFARGYNGTAYAQNHYDQRLASAFGKESAG